MPNIQDIHEYENVSYDDRKSLRAYLDVLEQNIRDGWIAYSSELDHRTVDLANQFINNHAYVPGPMDTMLFGSNPLLFLRCDNPSMYTDAPLMEGVVSINCLVYSNGTVAQIVTLCDDGTTEEARYLFLINKQTYDLRRYPTPILTMEDQNGDPTLQRP